MGKRRIMWKWLFLGLLILNVFIIAFLFILLVQPFSGSEEQTEERQLEREPSEGFQHYFTLSLTTDQLKEIIEEEWQEEQLELDVVDSRLLEANLPLEILGNEVNATFEFEPEALDNGNMAFHQENFSLGGITLPSSIVLTLLESQLDVPEFVEIQPSEEQIVVHTNDIEVGEGFYAQAESFNLEEDDISVYVGRMEN